MAESRTLVLSLADAATELLGAPLSDWSVTWEVSYDRDVDVVGGPRVAGGVPIFRQVVAADEPAEVPVLVSDSPDLAERSRGFGVQVVAKLRPRAGARGGRREIVKRWLVTVPSSAAEPCLLSSLVGAEPVPAPYTSVEHILGHIDRQVDESATVAKATRLLPVWATALASQDKTSARAVVFGDSITEGWFSDTPIATNRALGRFQAALRQTPGGQGWLPAVYVGNHLLAEGSFSSAPGTNGVQALANFGLGLKGLGLPSGQWREWTVTTDRVRVWYATSDFLAANAEVLIDGVKVADLAGVAPQGQQPAARVWTSDPLPRGQHTIRVRAAGIDGFVFLLQALEVFDGDFGTGVHVADGAHFGYAVSDFNANTRWASTLALYQPHLVVIALGVNDSSSATAAVFEARLRQMIDTIESVLPAASFDLCIVSSFRRADQDPVSPWEQYVRAAGNVAADRGAYHLALDGWWSRDPTAGLLQDGVHPTPAGQRLYGGILATALGRPTWSVQPPQGPQGVPGNPTAYELRGTGQPEGVVTASPGTYYTDTSGTAGAWRWIKKTGTGATGWDVQHGDTGRRALVTWDASGAITSGALANADWVPHTLAGGVWVRRSGSRVTVEVVGVKCVTANTASPIVVLLNGFRPPVTQRQVTDRYPTAASLTALAVNVNGSVERASNANIAANDYLLGVTWTFDTKNAWPKTLPGATA